MPATCKIVVARMSESFFDLEGTTNVVFQELNEAGEWIARRAGE